jgi:hypothetical protein
MADELPDEEVEPAGEWRSRLRRETAERARLLAKRTVGR